MVVRAGLKWNAFSPFEYLTRCLFIDLRGPALGWSAYLLHKPIPQTTDLAWDIPSMGRSNHGTLLEEQSYQGTVRWECPIIRKLYYWTSLWDSSMGHHCMGSSTNLLPHNGNPYMGQSLTGTALYSRVHRGSLRIIPITRHCYRTTWNSPSVCSSVQELEKKMSAPT